MSLLEDILTATAVLCFQAYLTLMIRSEINKLTNSSNFRFVNNQAELVADNKSDHHAILQEQQEYTESGIDDSQLAHIY
ncbi:hypothetical protein evm_012517 [Chilo suppressalis]|nr:hypothetical protein evm_012517 [Chilo suppressalis]